MAIASLILGIASVSMTVSTWLAFWFGPTAAGICVFLSMASGAAGLVLGCMDRDVSKRSMANVGKILSIVGLGISFINMIGCISCAACLCAEPRYYYYY